MKRLLVMLLTACGSGDGPDSPDAGPIADFFGEACESAPPSPAGEPVATLCRDTLGWCVGDVCRPACSAEADQCPGGVRRRAVPGVCYCAPE